MAAIITVASQKGGVGKTTTVVNLSASLALAGKRVLLIDLDPQANASSGVGFAKQGSQGSRGSRTADHQSGLLRAIHSEVPLGPLVVESRFSNLSVLIASSDLSQLDLIQEVQDRYLGQFRSALQSLASAYEYVLVDCPPSLGGLPTIALAASRHVLIPVQCEYYAMEGLSQILPVIQKTRQTVNDELEIGGLLLTMFSEELELSHEVVREISGYFQDSVFRTIVPRDVALAEAASHGVPAVEYALESRGAWSYVELAREVLEYEWS